MRLSITLLIAFLTIATIGMNAQIVDKTKDKAKNKANNRVDRKIDQGLEKGLDTIEGLFKKKDKKKKTDESNDSSGSEAKESAPSNNNETQSMPNMGAMFGSSADVESEYNFQHRVTMQMEMYDKKGKQEEKMDMVSMWSDDGKVMGMEMEVDGSQSYTVMDMESYQTITLINTSGMKTGMIVKVDPSTIEEVEAEDNMMGNFKKTGRTKEILGYMCDEYEFSDEESHGSMWISQKEIIKMAYGAYQNTQAFERLGDFPTEGMFMEMEMIDNKNPQEKMIMKVTDIKKDQPSSISTEGYSFFGG